MKITEAQVEAVSMLDAKQRYDHSIKMIADTQEMYSLLDSEGNWELVEVEGRIVFFIWSAEEYAVPFTKNEWQDSLIEKITTEEFNEEIASFLDEKNYLLSLFSLNNQTGYVVNVVEFKRDLDKELENY